MQGWTSDALSVIPSHILLLIYPQLLFSLRFITLLLHSTPVHPALWPVWWWHPNTKYSMCPTVLHRSSQPSVVLHTASAGGRAQHFLVLNTINISVTLCYPPPPPYPPPHILHTRWWGAFIAMPTRRPRTMSPTLFPHKSPVSRLFPHKRSATCDTLRKNVPFLDWPTTHTSSCVLVCRKNVQYCKEL